MGLAFPGITSGHLTVAAVAQMTRLSARMCLECDARWVGTETECWQCGGHDLRAVSSAAMTSAKPSSEPVEDQA